MKITVSVIIPLKTITKELRDETLPAILGQSNQDFEIIILPDKKTNEEFLKTKIIPTWPKEGPADKRDIGVQKSTGEILAFLDDDSYPNQNWLKNALKIFAENKNFAGVCGPQLTPPNDNLRQKASGYVWSSWLGSGGAGTYRCAIAPAREIDDYPSVNLLVRKEDFLAAGGFDSHFWPGEDTKLCHDLVYKLGKKVIYNPQVVVYHHRREIFGPHLKQISRYALHRGHFARILPKTSLRLGYLVPSFFVLGLIFGLILSFIHPVFRFIYLVALGFYLVELLLVALKAGVKEKSLSLVILVALAIIATHLTYGALFIKGFLTPKLKSYYHR